MNKKCLNFSGKALKRYTTKRKKSGKRIHTIACRKWSVTVLFIIAETITERVNSKAQRNHLGKSSNLKYFRTNPNIKISTRELNIISVAARPMKNENGKMCKRKTAKIIKKEFIIENYK
tara:strand:- start:166 stop:522 length:357 start_codon:yes stop_codon:yes gene_type:complete